MSAVATPVSLQVNKADKCTRNYIKYIFFFLCVQLEIRTRIAVIHFELNHKCKDNKKRLV